MTDPTPLSPAAQVIVNAAIEDDYGKPTPVLYRRLAAALRAAADQLGYCLDGSAYFVVAKDDILTIAAELEAQ